MLVAAEDRLRTYAVEDGDIQILPIELERLPICAWSTARSAIRTRTYHHGGVQQIDVQNFAGAGPPADPMSCPGNGA